MILPVPAVEAIPEHRWFWEAAEAHRLLMPFCSSCDDFFWHPARRCLKCDEVGMLVEVSGLGTIYAAATIRRGVDAYASVGPYVAAVVELDEGGRLLTNLVVEPSGGPEWIGTRVEVVFHNSTDGGNAVPRFRPLTGST